MARPIWRGSLSFGLVAIPVQMHTAVREHRPRFRLLHAKDKSPIRYERVCQRDGTAVAWEDLVKGYEYERGRYVVLTKEDFKAAAVEKDRRVQVSDFVPADAIDDRYFDQPYYLLPDKGGEHAYAVFHKALAEAGRVGVGKVVMRERQHLVAVESIGEHLVLTMMRFADEVTEPPAADIGKITVPPRELKLATSLIDALATDWEPEKYSDDYQKNLQEVIKAKMKGKTVVLEEEGEPMRADVVDLAERLRQSLKIAGGTAKPTARRAKPQPARSRKAASTRGRRKRAA
jgi:DNA end-binding protein Ku